VSTNKKQSTEKLHLSGSPWPFG